MDMYPVWADRMQDGSYAVMAMTGWGVMTLDEFATIDEYGKWLQSMTALFTKYNIPIPEYIRRAFDGG